MSFPTNVERWRSLVAATVSDEVGRNSAYKSLENALGLTDARLVEVVLGIIQKESSGNPSALGDDGKSLGLMQLNFGAGTPQSVGFTGGKDELLDPSTNVRYGVRYFLSQLNRYRDLNKAILAYNAGSVVLKAGLPINLDYLNAVLSFVDGKKNSSPLVSPPPPQSSSPSGTLVDDEAAASGTVAGTSAPEPLQDEPTPQWDYRSRIIRAAFFIALAAIAFSPLFCSK